MPGGTLWTAAVTELGQQGDGLGQVQVVAITGQMRPCCSTPRARRWRPPSSGWTARAVTETSELQARFALPPYHLNSTYTLPNCSGSARHRADVFRATACVLWPKDYLRYRLTGLQLTDYTEAGGAALLDWRRTPWATDRLAAVGSGPRRLAAAAPPA